MIRTLATFICACGLFIATYAIFTGTLVAGDLELDPQVFACGVGLIVASFPFFLLAEHVESKKPQKKEIKS